MYLFFVEATDVGDVIVFGIHMVKM